MYHSKLDVIVSTAIYIYICIFDYKIGFVTCSNNVADVLLVILYADIVHSHVACLISQ